MSASKQRPPPRDGIAPSTVVLPAGHWPSVWAFLCERFSHIPADVWRTRLAAGDVLDDSGQAIQPNTPYTPHTRLYYYRQVADEARIPFDDQILWHDDHLLVVDKPHFLPVIPTGKYVRETLLYRLQNRLGLPHLAPIHRIDRDTAGLVLFSVNPATRARYQNLFRDRLVHKVYEANAPWDANRAWPLQRHTRIERAPHFMQQIETDGPPNALTHIEVIASDGIWARYRLQPHTGQRHQLRVHMAALGLPIVNDGIYPVLTPEGACDWNYPLQLLAQSLSFTDPLSGQLRAFSSQRQLNPLAALPTPPTPPQSK